MMKDPTKVSSSSCRLLLVDDDQGLLKLMQKALSGEGYQISWCTSGLDVVEWLKQNDADLILLDLHLPDLSGPRLLRRLAEVKAPLNFIVITGHGDERVAVEMMK